MNIIDVFEEEFNSDDVTFEKKQSDLTHLYHSSSEREKRVIDDVLSILCGYGFRTLTKKSKGE